MFIFYLNISQGIPVISSEIYDINIFVDAEYKEMLIEIQQENHYFRWRMTKTIEV